MVIPNLCEFLLFSLTIFSLLLLLCEQNSYLFAATQHGINLLTIKEVKEGVFVVFLLFFIMK